ncbi:hypothetical protein ES703_118487 [subsurface metagenome]
MLPVSIKAVAKIVKEPPTSIFRAVPKNLLGLGKALASTPPVSIFPEWGQVVLYARANLVTESKRMTTSFLYSTSLLAFSNTISATWTWRLAGSSKVEAITSPLTLRSISVTSSGLSPTKRMIKIISGWLVVMELAIFCNRMVFPARGGETIRPLCPFPMGVNRSMTLSEIVSAPVSSLILSLGYRGVRLSNSTLSLASSGFSKFTASTLSKAKNFSLALGGRI